MRRSKTVIDFIWDQYHLVELERMIWLLVMSYQNSIKPELVSLEQIESSARVKEEIDLESIAAREAVTKHDIKARIEEFSELSGHQRIHLGMTSADIVENTYAIRIRESLIALGLTRRPAIAGWALTQPMRGIRGPIGNDQDQIELLGDPVAAYGLSKHVAHYFGFHEIYNAPTQILPRSIDHTLGQLIAAELDREYRIVVSALAGCFGDTGWLEGDVSTSVVRRYCWPMIFKICEEAIGAPRDAQITSEGTGSSTKPSSTKPSGNTTRQAGKKTASKPSASTNSKQPDGSNESTAETPSLDQKESSAKTKSKPKRRNKETTEAGPGSTPIAEDLPTRSVQTRNARQPSRVPADRTVWRWRSWKDQRSSVTGSRRKASYCRY